MLRPTRREFLKTAAVLGGGLALGDALALPRAALAQDPMALSVARWDPAALATADLAAAAGRLTEAAIAGLGGMGRFVSKGDVVWVKPNIGWNRAPALAADTNPDVVGALVRLCYEAGAKTVKVGDNPCHPARHCYATSGIAAAAEAQGAQVVFLDDRRFRDLKLGGERLDSWPLYPEIVEADLVINVPIAKHHGLTDVSLGMKNLMGVAGGQRSAWHQQMADCLCDVTAFLRPRLVVLDAVRVLTAHGPTGGDPADVTLVGTVAAGTDLVAIDALGATLLGHQPAAIASLGAAAARGLGTLDFRSLPQVERTLS
ncbi:MAG TPA: DUF362 domain-containing protein [Candidatus Krumholzibacteria bacterium]|nr:DUF362 domain-containing protein [Candidatus Krumholzibacteria bacterium]HPD72208.1 DUF362 domain-containing protein [Candidatus Krumholzibacteria bacterium]HRY40860.1 DUF362 domain-containing protein [Candidatus Krumholzibacteria bacterium]